MLVYAGIDEAGYGPMFGPLCVGASVFVLEGYDPANGAPDMWSILKRCVCKTKRDAKKRIAVNDSKKLKSGSTRKGLLHLERGVLSFLATMQKHEPFENDTQFFETIHCDTSTEPWCNEVTALPYSMDKQLLAFDAAVLCRGLAKANVRCELLSCTSVDAAKYNKRTEHASKAALNFSIAMHHVDTIIKQWPNEHPRIMVDRHGGRIQYRNDLQLCWPQAQIQVLAESSELSRYRIQIDSSFCTITFASKSDEKHLPVALASMVAKYTRELMMVRFNNYFSNLLPELKPTAGYVQDGRRFLKEIEPLLAKKGIKRELLVRSS
jgi:ribonuclease HII